MILRGIFKSRGLFALVLLLGLFLAAACGLPRGDRMYVSDEKYILAKGIYDSTNSLLLTERQLRAKHWQDGEVNEAIYRLKKQYRLE